MRRLARGYLLVISLLNGLSGLACGALFIASPDGALMGWEPLLSTVRELPLSEVFFQDFAWIGVAMLLALGIPNTIAAVMLIRRSERQYPMTVVAGILLLAWTGFELLFMYNVAAVGYFAVGLLSILASFLMMRPVRRPESA